MSPTADLERIAHLIGAIFYYGNFVIETPAERELAQLLEKTGFQYDNEMSILLNAQKYGWN